MTDNSICIYKYVSDFVNVVIKLLNVETKETNNGHTGDFVERTGIFFREVGCSSYDAPSFKFQT
jgi:hypothetical protein